MNTDQSFFTIICKSSKGELFAAERGGFDLTSEMRVVVDIIQGQVSGVQHVLEGNPAEGWLRDISEDIARECARIICDSGVVGCIPDDLRDFIDTHAPGALPVHKFEPAMERA